MKQRKPLRKISAKRLKMLNEGNGNHSYFPNSTIRRKPCDAMNAEKKQESRSPQTSTDSSSATRSTYRLKKSVAKTYSSENFGSKRKPVKKQSKKQQARLRHLASIRLKWWTDTRSSSKPLMCGICDEEVRVFEDLDSDHVIPGHGKSDSESNLQPSHKICNQLKGSRRNFKIVRGDRNWKQIHGLL